MTVTTEKGQLKIYLNEYEIIKYNVSEILFEEKSEIAKDVLLSLLKVAENEMGFKCDFNKISIEIYPILSGGCVICFIPKKVTKAERGIPLLRKAVLRKSVCILEFSNSESLICGISALYGSPKTRDIESSVYLIDKKYRLILPDGFTGHINMPTICSFCSRIITRRIEKVKTFEYGKLICYKNAVEKLGKCFTSQ